MSNSIIYAQKNYTEHPDINMFTMHTHEHHEIYCFLKGNAKYFVEGSIYSLSPGDILIMKKAEAHSLLINKCVPYERIIINFNDNAIVGDLKNNIAAFLNNREFGKNNLYSADEFKQNNWQFYLAKIYNSKNIDEQKLYLTVLLNELYTHASSVNNKNVPKDDIVDILEYINQNIANEITLTSLCERFFVSKTHLIRKFKNITGSTVWEYILTKRLLLAKNLMQTGEHPTAVAIKCGFNDYSSFFKAYKKKFGISPKVDLLKK